MRMRQSLSPCLDQTLSLLRSTELQWLLRNLCQGTLGDLLVAFLPQVLPRCHLLLDSRPGNCPEWTGEGSLQMARTDSGQERNAWLLLPYSSCRCQTCWREPAQQSPSPTEKSPFLLSSPPFTPLQKRCDSSAVAPWAEAGAGRYRDPICLSLAGHTNASGCSESFKCAVFFSLCKNLLSFHLREEIKPVLVAHIWETESRRLSRIYSHPRLEIEILYKQTEEGLGMWPTW